MAENPALPDAAYVVALTHLPGMGPRRLDAVLALGAREAWAAVCDGRAGRVPEVAEAIGGRLADLSARWQAAAASVEVARRWADHEQAGVEVLVPGDPAYPDVLRDDPERPAVLYRVGEAADLDGPRVGIVGTRRCTRYGHDVAFEMGRDLSERGVRVVSGLALGIDAAAHRGALEGTAPPIGVVAHGLDVVYPRRNRELFALLRANGVLFSEAPLGVEPEPWRFPARNRIIAGLADAVVVVESHAEGGSLYTVEAAVERGIPVLAVPGSVRSSASVGTNQLVADGTEIARNGDDVLVALGLHAAASGARRSDHRPEPGPEARLVLDALGWEPATFEHLAMRTGLGLGPLGVALTHLEADGWLTQCDGWYEQRSR